MTIYTLAMGLTIANRHERSTRLETPVYLVVVPLLVDPLMQSRICRRGAQSGVLRD